jgi:membrane dipeptidase
MKLLAASLFMIAIPLSLPSAPVPVLDMHSDLLLRAIDNGVDLVNGPSWTQSTIPRVREGGVTDQIYAVWVDSHEYHGLDATQRALRIIDLFQQQADQHADQFALARTVAEAREIEASGRVAVWLWIEGGSPIDDDLALLRTFHRLGIAGMTLAWMHNLDWVGTSSVSPEDQMGLTDFGRDVVREMNRLGMVVDLSHASDQAFWDALEVSSDPIVLTHSGCRALCDHPRNVTDEMLRALGEKGGVIGINSYPGYMSREWERARDRVERAAGPDIARLRQEHGGNTPEFRAARSRLFDERMDPSAVVTLDTYLDQIEHAMEVAGPEHVALGADFDGIWAFTQGLENSSKWQAVADGLRTRGHSEEEIRGVMRDNALRVLEQVIDH